MTVAPRVSTYSPEPELGGRVSPRYRVAAQAIWSVDETEVRWPVWTLSWGGAALVVGALTLPADLKLRVQFREPQRVLGSADTEVVYTSGKRMGLRFLKMDERLRRTLDELFAELTPLE
jgi:c-di-GMP-binding flagellar brake protein YcgR